MKHTVSLKKNHEFRRLYGKGKSAVCPYFAIYCRKTNRPYSRLGITTGVKLGKAVVRNRCRRRIRELYRLAQPGMKQGYDLVIVARSRCFNGPYQKLSAAFNKALGQLDLLAEDRG